MNSDKRLSRFLSGLSPEQICELNNIVSSFKEDDRLNQFCYYIGMIASDLQQDGRPSYNLAFMHGMQRDYVGRCQVPVYSGQAEIKMLNGSHWLAYGGYDYNGKGTINFELKQ